MGIFADQIGRLVRTRWTGPNGAQNLSEELVALLQSDTPIRITSPLVLIGGDNGNPPLTIISRPTDDGFVPPIVTTTAGGNVPNNKLPEGFEPFVPEEPPPDETPDTTPLPQSYIGQVVSKVGGVIYNCRIWAQGSTEDPPTATGPVEMKNLSADATLPNSAWIPVIVNAKATFDSAGNIVSVVYFAYGFPSVFYEPQS